MRVTQLFAPVRLACFAGSPVYYQAPLYRRLAADPRLDFTAIFASSAGAVRPLDNGYGKPVEWGVDAISGYKSVFLRRADRNPTGGGVFALRDLDIARILMRERYEALWLHGYHTITHVVAGVTQRMLGGSRLFREDQTLLSHRPRWKTALKSVGLPTFFGGGYALYVGAQNLRWFRHWGFPEHRTFHVPYAVENDALQAAASALAPQRNQLREQFGIVRVAEPVILTVSRLIPKKQPLHLLEAFRRVRSKYACTLLVVGSGPLEHELHRTVVADNIPDVVFTGFLDQTEIARAYAAADLFALVSSHDETWGMVVNEAMNFGLPIIASDRVGSASDLVEPGRNGFIVPHDDIDVLCDALARVVGSATLRKRLGEASLEMIAPRTYDVTAAKMVAAVRAVVGESRWALAESGVREGIAA